MVRLFTYGRIMLLPVQIHLARLQKRLDGRLLRAEVGPEGEAKKGLPTWAIVVIILVVLLCAIPICLLVLVPFILALLGPSIGNVFSNIIEEIEVTPVQ